MREALTLQLEKFSYYQHLSLSGGQERPIYSSRVLDIRGSRYHVLSRIQDAGLDFTGRTNFLAHHLVFTPEEIRQFPSPPVILGRWPGWLNQWNQEPQSLENEDWSGLAGISGTTSVPATTWQQVTGDAVNGYGLLESRAGIVVRVDNLTEQKILALFAESLELLELRDPRRDFRVTAWQYTFTTSMQDQDNPADFRWRCLHSDNPASNRFAGPDTRLLSSLQATKLTDEEKDFARKGRQPPKFVKLAADKSDIQEGTAVKLEVTSDGIPIPTIRWFEIEHNEPKELLGKSGTIQNLNPEGRSKRYQVQAFNTSGSADSNVVEISIRAPLKVPALQHRTTSGMRPTPVVNIDDDPYETLNQKYANENAKQGHKFPVLLLLAVLALLLAVGAVVFLRVWHKEANEVTKLASIKDHVTNEISSRAESSNKIAATPASSPEPTTTVALHPALSEGAASLPLPWKWVKVGNTGEPMTPFDDNNTFTFIGTGNNFRGNTDSFLFTSQPASNSDEFIVRLLNVSRGTNTCQCGIMMRESNKPNAPFVFLGISSTNIIWTQRHSSEDDCKSEFVSKAKLPMFLRLQRNPDFFIGDISTDGINWDSGKSNQVSMTESNYLVGFAVTSGKPAIEVNAEFDSITNRVIGAKQ